MTNALKIETFPYYFAIAKIRNPASINWKSPFVFVGKTDDELSLVELESEVPSDAYPVDRGYRMMRVAGTLDMSLTGILARISKVLADEEIPIFAVSTYNTDYILVKSHTFRNAIQALSRAGYLVSNEIS